MLHRAAEISAREFRSSSHLVSIVSEDVIKSADAKATDALF